MRCDQPPTRPTMRVRRTPAARLRDALCELAQRKTVILGHSETNWASITFAGTRHRIELAFDGAQAVEAGEQFIASLPDHEFAIPGQLVAEATVIAVDHRPGLPRMKVTCEVLLLDES